MKKNVSFFVDDSSVYYRMLVEALIDELQEICPDTKCGYVSNLKDIIKANLVVACGNGNFPKKLSLGLNVLRKPLILYHMLPGGNNFSRIQKWIVAPRNIEGYNYYPSPVLLSDIPTQKNIERVWKRERLASKRGCIGVIGLDINEGLRDKLLTALNLLVEDLDLNVIFIPLKKTESERYVLSSIKYSANFKYIQAEKVSSKELLGIISRIDLLVATDEKSALCAMAVNRPIAGLSTEDNLRELLKGMTEEEITLDFNALSAEELYTKIKIAWVHRASIAEQMQKRIAELRAYAEEGIRKLCRDFVGV